ncbi:GyrI-like domain-containing protein [Clostridium arbusti]|uniref:GyrI-like domain-containing protein n=1 Tax=Clostridium arbusti TaxID=1137848 RepID=UPI000289B8F3|nr:effector binding domain-containing protein [Clostridium arbusti]
MEWIGSLKLAINYMEKHLLENISADEVADAVYMIAGTYNGSSVPEGMKIFEISALEWAKFKCTGPLPGSLQSVNTQIFKAWLPGNPDYEIATGMNIEWYSNGDCSSSDYESEIWIPVKKKQ